MGFLDIFIYRYRRPAGAWSKVILRFGTVKKAQARETPSTPSALVFDAGSRKWFFYTGKRDLTGYLEPLSSGSVMFDHESARR